MIKLIISIFHSKRDRNGNVYWAFHATDPATGTTVCGKITGGESNIRAAAHLLTGDDRAYHYSVTEEPIRQFNRHIADFPYAGCNPQYQIARFIKEGLKWEIQREVYTIIASRPAQPGREGNGFVHYVTTLDKPGSIARTFRIHLDREYAVGTQIQTTDQCFEENGAAWSREVPKGTKLFKIGAISSNTNSFGLTGHIIVALDGECWEFARARYDDSAWQVGTILELTTKDTVASALSALSCEIPHQRDRASQPVVRELWGI